MRETDNSVDDSSRSSKEHRSQRGQDSGELAGSDSGYDDLRGSRDDEKLGRSRQGGVQPEPYSDHQHNPRSRGVLEARRDQGQNPESDSDRRGRSHHHISNDEADSTDLQPNVWSRFDRNQIIGMVYTVKQDNIKLSKEYAELKYHTESVGRQRDRFKAAMEKLQTERLVQVDRFQPVFDESIGSKFRLMRNPVSKLSRFIASNLKSNLATEDLQEELIIYSWISCYDMESAVMELEDKGSRRRIWTSVIWMFLEHKLFRHPFLALASNGRVRWMDCTQSSFRTLVSIDQRKLGILAYTRAPEECDESARWRTSTVEGLRTAQSEDDDAKLKTRIQQDFLSLLRRLEYDTEVTKRGENVQGLVKDLLDKIIPFAKMLAGQRAIFRLLVPSLGILEPKKEVDDRYMTNRDDEFDNLDDEIEGEVGYLVKPGLIKFGTGIGQKLDSEETILVPAFIDFACMKGKA
jgi:hypothetical protein